MGDSRRPCPASPPSSLARNRNCTDRPSVCLRALRLLGPAAHSLPCRCWLCNAPRMVLLRTTPLLLTNPGSPAAPAWLRRRRLLPPLLVPASAPCPTRCRRVAATRSHQPAMQPRVRRPPPLTKHPSAVLSADSSCALSTWTSTSLPKGMSAAWRRSSDVRRPLLGCLLQPPPRRATAALAGSSTYRSAPASRSSLARRPPMVRAALRRSLRRVRCPSRRASTKRLSCRWQRRPRRSGSLPRRSPLGESPPPLPGRAPPRGAAPCILPSVTLSGYGRGPP